MLIIIIVLGVLLGISVVINLNLRSDCNTQREWKNEYWDRLAKQTQNIKEVGDLLENGWVVTATWFDDFRHWSFQAPDEDGSRIFEKAVERQKILDKCKALNLPVECVTALKEGK